MNYWETRQLKERVRLFNLTADDIMRLLRKEYIRSYRDVERQLKELILEMGNNPTADQLYRSDKYYKLLNAISKRLEDLGVFENNTLRSKFTTFYQATVGKEYMDLVMPSEETILRAIDSVWAGDGMNFSQRIWRNKKQLINKLSQGLVDTVTTGKNWGLWSKEIKETFNSSFFEAKRLVVTELSHIQCEATVQKYAAEGVEYVRYVAEIDCCPTCNNNKDRVFPITNVPGIPMHPNCRCTYIPVVMVNGIPINTLNQEI